MRPGRTPRRAVRGALTAFAVATVGGVGFALAYVLDADTPWYGLSLLLAFGGLGHGLVAWAHRLMPPGGEVEDRPHLSVSHRTQRAAAAELEKGTEAISRRRLLGTSMATALGVTGVGMALPVASLGARPHEALRHTPWGQSERPRVIDGQNRPLRPDDLAVGEVVTVYPEGHREAADAQTLLLRLPAQAELRPPARVEWTVDGIVAYSKVCTHAGCPVGLYQQERQELFCPCHQSAFDVLAGARPTMGPAVRPLPQLPLELDGDGYLVAGGDFPDAIGPGWWSRP